MGEHENCSKESPVSIFQYCKNARKIWITCHNHNLGNTSACLSLFTRNSNSSVMSQSMKQKAQANHMIHIKLISTDAHRLRFCLKIQKNARLYLTQMILAAPLLSVMTPRLMSWRPTSQVCSKLMLLMCHWCVEYLICGMVELLTYGVFWRCTLFCR